jgi:5-methyltetrahydrofolate--homocysteine methyltransferase
LASASTQPGVKKLTEEMTEGDYSRVESDAIAQVEAGAHMLDVNAGLPMADEAKVLAEECRLYFEIF